jgi:hypothetical protein
MDMQKVIARLSQWYSGAIHDSNDLVSLHDTNIANQSALIAKWETLFAYQPGHIALHGARIA